MARVTLGTYLRRSLPPWWQRTFGGKVVDALGAVLDDLLVDTAAGAKLRFPTDTPDPASLALTGRERRIRRGPAEAAATYARRLRTWWDAHRTRGGPYALLGQLFAFFRDWLGAPIDVVYHSGTVRAMAADGTITRGSVTWDADGTASWARFWVFFYVTDPITIGDSALETEGGDLLVTEGGDFLVAEDSIAPDELTATEEEIFRSIVREWSAAHVDWIGVVLLWGDRRLWNYPQPVPTWAAWGLTSTWGEPPTILEIN